MEEGEQRWRDRDSEQKREREKIKKIKRERAPLGYNHSLSFKMTYK